MNTRMSTLPIYSIVFPAILMPGTLPPRQARADTNVGGLIINDTTWTPAGSPYVVTSSIVIGNNKTLTIEAGVEVRFNDDLTILVGSSTFGVGTLKAQGTPGSRITFRSNNQPQVHGDWAGIYFTDFAADAAFDANDSYVSGSVLQYAVVEFAGGPPQVGAINIESSRPYLSHTEIGHSYSSGLSIAASGAPSQRIDNCEIWDCFFTPGSAVESAIVLSGGTGHRLSANNVHDNRRNGVNVNATATTLADNKFSNNAGYGVVVSGASCVCDSNIVSGNIGYGVVFANTPAAMITGNTVSGNGAQGVSVTNATVVGTTTARITGNTISGNGASGANGGGLYVSHSPSIVVTSNTITGNGEWYGGIVLYNCSNCTVASNTITGNTTILNDESGGIYLRSSPGCVLRDNEITGNHTTLNGASGLGISGSPNVTLDSDPVNGVYNRIHDNDPCDLRNGLPFNVNGTNNVNAKNVWWGTCDVNCVQEAICDFFDDATKAFVLFLPIVEPGGDYDWDGDVDLADTREAGGCLTGPRESVDCDSLTGHCGVFDFDCDHDVDLHDLAEWQNVFTGE